MVQARVEAKSDFQDQLRDLFTHFDKDSNGYLDEYEFTELVRCSFPYSISKRQAEGMYRKGMELRAELVVRVAALMCRAGWLLVVHRSVSTCVCRRTRLPWRWMPWWVGRSPWWWRYVKGCDCCSQRYATLIRVAHRF